VKDIQWSLIWKLLEKIDSGNQPSKLDHKCLGEKISSSNDAISKRRLNFENSASELQTAVSTSDMIAIEKSLRSMESAARYLGKEMDDVVENIDKLMRRERPDFGSAKPIKMTLEDAKRKLFENNKTEDDSFLDYLHESSVFNTEEFWELYNALAIIQSSDLVHEDEIRQTIFSVYSYILRAMIWHYNPRDTSEIKHLPDNLAQYIEALHWVSEHAILGHKIARFGEFGEEELPNPRAAELTKYFLENGFKP
jgi:hypothetical protein